MPTGLINITIDVSGTYSSVLHVTTYPASNPLVSDGTLDVQPPFTNPVSISIVVPTQEAHFVKILDVNNNLVAFNVVNFVSGGSSVITPLIYNFKVGAGNNYNGSNTFTLNASPYDFRNKNIIIMIKGGTPLVSSFSFNFVPTTGQFSLIGDQWNTDEIGSIVGI